MRKPDNIKDIFLKAGEFFWGGPEYRVTTALGSCIAICVWHPQKKIGGMCHYQMPGRRMEKREELNSKYGDDVMWLILDKIKQNETEPKEYRVKIFGGAEALLKDQTISFFNIGQKNIEAAVDRLKRFGFSIHAKNVGGGKHYRIIFELWSGDVLHINNYST